MSKLFQCYVCQAKTGRPADGRFEAETDTCPACGASGPQRIAPVACIHFDAPSDLPGVGVGYLACDPAVKVPCPQGYAFTGQPSAVTCPACKRTEAFRAADYAERIDPLHDVPVKISSAAGVTLG